MLFTPQRGESCPARPLKNPALGAFRSSSTPSFPLWHFLTGYFCSSRVLFSLTHKKILKTSPKTPNQRDAALGVTARELFCNWKEPALWISDLLGGRSSLVMHFGVCFFYLASYSTYKNQGREKAPRAVCLEAPLSLSFNQDLGVKKNQTFPLLL